MCAARRPSALTHTSPPTKPPHTTTLKDVALLNGVSSVGQPYYQELGRFSFIFSGFGQTFVPPAAPNNLLSSFSFYWSLAPENAGHNVQAVRDALQKSFMYGL